MTTRIAKCQSKAMPASFKRIASIPVQTWTVVALYRFVALLNGMTSRDAEIFIERHQETSQKSLLWMTWSDVFRLPGNG